MIDGDSDHRHPTAGPFAGEILEHRNLASAWGAPGRPEVDDQGLAGKSGDRGGFSRAVGERELRQPLRNFARGQGAFEREVAVGERRGGRPGNRRRDGARFRREGTLRREVTGIGGAGNTGRDADSGTTS